MRRIATGLVIIMWCAAIFGSVAAAAPSSVGVRVKDIAKVQGVRNNQLVGYGLVVGLNGTGDSNKSPQTIQSQLNMLKASGVNINSALASQIQPKNVAAVIVTAQLPPFIKPGDTIDVTVSSMGDAKSLQGGILIQTPLKAANGMVYAVGQGAVSLGGFSATGGGGNSAQKNFPTVGTIANGALVERDVPAQLMKDGNIALALSNPDFTTATRIGQAVEYRFGVSPTVSDPGTVVIPVPGEYWNNVVGFVASLEDLVVTPDNIAKVVVNERTGTVVLGGNVAIDEVAVAQGGLVIKITKAPEVSQPNPLAAGNTVVTNQTNLNVEEKPAGLIVLKATANVNDVVSSLNAVGATPRDIIAILQAMKAAGALHADLQVI